MCLQQYKQTPSLNMLLQVKESSNRLGARMSLQAPLNREIALGRAKKGSNGFISPKQTANSLVRDKLQAIKKHIFQLVSEHPNSTKTITEGLRQVRSSLIRLAQLSNQQPTNTGTQTDEPYLPAFCHQISEILDKPKPPSSEKCSAQYLRARRAIEQEMCEDNQALVRENLKLTEENLQLSETVSCLTRRYNETTRKYEELERTIEKLHEVGSLYNSKVLPEGEDPLTDTGKFLFSPRSSNLSGRKSCLSSKNILASPLFDRFSNRRVGFNELSSLPKTHVYEERGVQTQRDIFKYNPDNFQYELIFYENAVGALTSDNASKELILAKVESIISNYLGKHIGALTLDNVSDFLEQVYRRRSWNLIRRKTMGSEDIEDPSSLQLCASEKKIETVDKSCRRITRRRGLA